MCLRLRFLTNLMKIEVEFATWDVHSTEQEFKGSFPAVLFREDTEDKIGYTIHKWETENPKGKFIAICNINQESWEFDVSDIEHGEKVADVHVFKYHASKWRPVEWNKKWNYKNKNQTNHVHRILK